jgi:murein peptide amidase A
MVLDVQSPSSVEVHPHRLRRLYRPFLALAEEYSAILGTVVGSFESSGRRYTIPRFVYRGAPRGCDPIRLGMFALLHGDEPAGALGLAQLLDVLMDDPELGAGYELLLYPVCNPVGYENGTRENGTGRDLNREFWRGSGEPEVRILEEELERERLHGVIALHADDTSKGVYGYTQGRLLNEYLLSPALAAAARILSVDTRPLIDGFTARGGMIEGCFPGVLSPPQGVVPRPFELILETPAHAPLTLQGSALGAALCSILETYRAFLSQGAHL